MKIEPKVIFLAIIGLFGVAMLIILRSILTPVLIALALAYIAEPLLRRLQQNHIPRWVSATVLYLFCLILLSLAAIFVGPRIGQQAQELYKNVAGLAEDYEKMLAPDEEQDAENGGQKEPSHSESEKDQAEESRSDNPVAAWERRIREFLQLHAGEAASRVTTVATTVGRNALKGVNQVIRFIVGLILVLIFTFFFMLHFHEMTETVKRYLPAAHRQRTLHILQRIDEAFSSFFRGRLLVCLISAIVYSLGLWLSGIDFWLLIGAVGGLLSFIPILGVLVSMIPAGAFALLTDHPWRSLLGVLITFSIVQWFIEPVAGTVILSRKVSMHPVTVMLSLLIGGYLFGIFGVILSVPLAAIVRILSEEFVVPPLREISGQKNDLTKPPA
jgi:predicted PurR-regulated permease PerM